MHQKWDMWPGTCNAWTPGRSDNFNPPTVFLYKQNKRHKTIVKLKLETERINLRFFFQIERVKKSCLNHEQTTVTSFMQIIPRLQLGHIEKMSIFYIEYNRIIQEAKGTNLLSAYWEIRSVKTASSSSLQNLLLSVVHILTIPSEHPVTISPFSKNLVLHMQPGCSMLWTQVPSALHN